MRDIIQYASIFVDGRGYFGESQKAELPKITLATRDFEASGMAAPIKVRLSRLASAMEMTLHYNTMPADLWDLFTISEGEIIPFRLKASVQGNDGTITKHEIVARGFVEEFDDGSWEDGKEAPLTHKISLRHYERHIGGVERWVVNPENMIIRRNGVDLLSEHRVNIGR